MISQVDQMSELLREAGEAHHMVYRILDGADEDWASWYSSWLIDLSELPSLLGDAPLPSHLTALLVELDRALAVESPDEPWQDHYARRILNELGSG